MTYKEAIANPNTKYNVYGKTYIASTDALVVGDVIIDRTDGLCGVVEIFHDLEHVAVRDGMTVELGIHINKLVKLVEINV